MEPCIASQEHVNGALFIARLPALTQQGAVTIDGLGRHGIVVKVLFRLVHSDFFAAASAGNAV